MVSVNGYHVTVSHLSCTAELGGSDFMEFSFVLK
jgi:hypothetical protein